MNTNTTNPTRTTSSTRTTRSNALGLPAHHAYQTGGASGDLVPLRSVTTVGGGGDRLPFATPGFGGLGRDG